MLVNVMALALKITRVKCVNLHNLAFVISDFIMILHLAKVILVLMIVVYAVLRVGLAQLAHFLIPAFARAQEIQTTRARIVRLLANVQRTFSSMLQNVQVLAPQMIPANHALLLVLALVVIIFTRTCAMAQTQLMTLASHVNYKEVVPLITFGMRLFVWAPVQKMIPANHVQQPETAS
jgi:hypothetical protein